MASAQPHRIAALCLEPVVAFDLSTCPPRSSRSPGAAAGPLYELTACAADGRAASPPRPASRSAAWPGSRRSHEADTVLVPGYREVLDPPPAPRARALRAAADPRRADGLDLHRRLRARPRRACSTAAARPPTGSRPASMARASRRSRSSRTRSTSRRARPHLGRALGRDRPLPAPRPLRPRRAGRLPGRAGDGRRPAPRRRPGAVHRARAARGATATARWSPCAPGRSTTSTSRSTSRPSPRRAGGQPADVRPPLRRRDGDHAAEVAARPARARGPPTARAHRPRRRAGRRALRVRLGAVAARALPPRHRDHADRVPARVRRRPLDRSTTPSRSVTVPIRFAAGVVPREAAAAAASASAAATTQTKPQPMLKTSYISSSETSPSSAISSNTGGTSSGSEIS